MKQPIEEKREERNETLFSCLSLLVKEISNLGDARLLKRKNLEMSLIVRFVAAALLESPLTLFSPSTVPYPPPRNKKI
jgi:hypothetical protein